MDRALSQTLSPAEGELAEAELEQLEADYARLEHAEELPSAPKVGPLQMQAPVGCAILRPQLHAQLNVCC